jgi:hypothetical protein
VYSYKSFSNINYIIIYEGFVALEEESVVEYPGTDTIVFENEDQWINFTINFFPMLDNSLKKQNKYVNFDNYYLICKVIMPTDAIYNKSYGLKKISYNDDIIDVEITNVENPLFITGINDRIIYPYILLLSVKRGDFENVENKYIKRPEY